MVPRNCILCARRSTVWEDACARKSFRDRTPAFLQRAVRKCLRGWTVGQFLPAWDSRNRPTGIPIHAADAGSTFQAHRYVGRFVVFTVVVELWGRRYSNLAHFHADAYSDVDHPFGG